MADMQKQLNRHLWSYKSEVRVKVFKVMNIILGVFTRQTANVARDVLEI